MINKTEKSTVVLYKVTFGPKKEKDREWKLLYTEDEALEFFKKKEDAGMNVDVYKVTTVTSIETEKLTK